MPRRPGEARVRRAFEVQQLARRVVDARVEGGDAELALELGDIGGLAEQLRGRLGTGLAGPSAHSAAGQPQGDEDHKRLWSALGHDPTGMDELARRTGLTVAALSSMLLLMELEGRVVADNGRYARRP